MKARLKPRPSKNYADILIRLEGYFNFKYAYQIENGDVYLAPVDKNWPSSTPVIETDLMFKLK